MLEKMIKESIAIFDYEDEVSNQYKIHSKSMLEDINTSMREEENIIDLLGDNPFSLMDLNHENHIQFMKNVIKYRQKELLVHTLPWVYKAYTSKGVEYDYFVTELKHWIKAIEKNVEHKYQEALVKIYQQMLEWHDDLIEISESDMIHEFNSNITWSYTHEEILRSLLIGDFRNLISVSNDMLNNGTEIVDFYVNYLQVAMYKVGELWENGEITVAHEHLATSTIARVMSSIYPNYVLCESDKGSAIVSAGINEFHQIGARMVADALEANGWDVVYLGSNVPIEELLILVEEVKPKFIALSMTMAFHTDEMIATVATLKDKFSVKGTKVMVGGLALNNRIELQHLIGADAYPKSAEESVNVAEKWWLDGK